jgi:hypothetical protein
MSTLGSYLDQAGNLYGAANGVEGGPVPLQVPTGGNVRTVSVVVNRFNNTLQVSMMNRVQVMGQATIPIPAGAILEGPLSSLQSFVGAFKAVAFTTGVGIAPTNENLIAMSDQLIDF